MKEMKTRKRRLTNKQIVNKIVFNDIHGPLRQALFLAAARGAVATYANMSEEEISKEFSPLFNPVAVKSEFVNMHEELQEAYR